MFVLAGVPFAFADSGKAYGEGLATGSLTFSNVGANIVGSGVQKTYLNSGTTLHKWFSLSTAGASDNYSIQSHSIATQLAKGRTVRSEVELDWTLTNQSSTSYESFEVSGLSTAYTDAWTDFGLFTPIIPGSDGSASGSFSDSLSGYNSFASIDVQCTPYDGYDFAYGDNYNVTFDSGSTGEPGGIGSVSYGYNQVVWLAPGQSDQLALYVNTYSFAKAAPAPGSFVPFLLGLAGAAIRRHRRP